MSGARSRRKGAGFEREVASALKAVFGGAHRGLQSRGEEVADVEVPYFWVECKRGKRTNPRAALAQAKAATDGRVPLAVCKDDRCQPVVLMELDEFVKLVAAVPGLSGE